MEVRLDRQCFTIQADRTHFATAGSAQDSEVITQCGVVRAPPQRLIEKGGGGIDPLVPENQRPQIVEQYLRDWRQQQAFAKDLFGFDLPIGRFQRQSKLVADLGLAWQQFAGARQFENSRFALAAHTRSLAPDQCRGTWRGCQIDGFVVSLQCIVKLAIAGIGARQPQPGIGGFRVLRDRFMQVRDCLRGLPAVDQGNRGIQCQRWGRRRRSPLAAKETAQPADHQRTNKRLRQLNSCRTCRHASPAGAHRSCAWRGRPPCTCHRS